MPDLDRGRRSRLALAAAFLAALSSPALAVPPDLVAIAGRIARFREGRGTAAESARLSELFDLYWSARMRVFPELATYVGYSGVDDRLSDLSPEGLAFAHRLPHLERAALDSIDRARLAPAERLNADLLRRRLELEIEGEKFGSLDPWTNDYLIVDSMTDRVSGALGLVVDMPARTAADYEHMLARLRAFPTLVDEGIARLKEGSKRGITPPRVTLGRVAAEVLGQIEDEPEKSPYLAPFRAIPDTIPGAQREAIRRESAALFRSEIEPALRRYGDYLGREYVPHARESI
ncbi:MAG TPA: DUF885 family protein, partial [Thermoanaerobaculia bacterium]|nr:DUF885 family protein [Thermoanaerobaculia bacterium]